MRPKTPTLCFPALQVSLYDVRRLANSSIVNFGSSRANQQLLLTHSVRARAQAAGFSSGGCSVSYGVAHADVHFLSDAVLNPVDPNLLAYIRPNLQVWSLVFLRSRMGWAGAIAGWSCVWWGVLAFEQPCTLSCCCRCCCCCCPALCAPRSGFLTWCLDKSYSRCPCLLTVTQPVQRPAPCLLAARWRRLVDGAAGTAAGGCCTRRDCWHTAYTTLPGMPSAGRPCRQLLLWTLAAGMAGSSGGIAAAAACRRRRQQQQQEGMGSRQRQVGQGWRASAQAAAAAAVGSSGGRGGATGLRAGRCFTGSCTLLLHPQQWWRPGVAGRCWLGRMLVWKLCWCWVEQFVCLTAGFRPSPLCPVPCAVLAGPTPQQCWPPPCVAAPHLETLFSTSNRTAAVVGGWAHSLGTTLDCWSASAPIAPTYYTLKYKLISILLREE